MVLPKLGARLGIKNAAGLVGICQNTLRDWESAGKLPVRQHSPDNYQPFNVSGLGKLLKMIERSAGKGHRELR